MLQKKDLKLKKLFILIYIFITVNIFALDFISPLEENYVVSSPFGYRKAVMGGMEDGLHRGIDIVPLSIEKNKKANARVCAVEDGTASVVFAPPGSIDKNGHKLYGHPLFGGLVIINHGNGISSLYGHMKEVWVNNGKVVKKGQFIGLVGSTGQSTGPHLHFEIDIDPTVLLATDLIKKLNIEPLFGVPFMPPEQKKEFPNLLH